MPLSTISPHMLPFVSEVVPLQVDLGVLEVLAQERERERERGGGGGAAHSSNGMILPHMLHVHSIPHPRGLMVVLPESEFHSCTSMTSVLEPISLTV